MSRTSVFCLFFLAVFLQAGAYGLTFMLPDLFAAFDADEKHVGQILSITAIATITVVYYSGHLADWLGRLQTLALACVSIAFGLGLFGYADGTLPLLALAAVTLGLGWGLTYALAPVALSRLIKPDETVRFFTMLSIFVMAGFGLSPVMASVMFDHGFEIADAFYVTAGLCLISALLFYLLVQPMRDQALNKAPETPSRLTIQSILGIFQSPAWLPVTMVFLGASVFAGMNNFQTVFAAERGLDYANYFLAYTITVIALRAVLAKFKGGNAPYLIIAALQYIMAFSVFIFIIMGNSFVLYILVAILFGIGYGASYPILVAMAAQDARADLVPQTLQLFALTYFIGIFGFPLLAGVMITKSGSLPVLTLVTIIAAIEASMSLMRGIKRRNLDKA